MLRFCWGGVEGVEGVGAGGMLTCSELARCSLSEALFSKHILTNAIVVQHSALMERRRMELRKSKTGILEFVSVSHIIRCNSKIKIHRKTGTEAQDKDFGQEPEFQ